MKVEHRAEVKALKAIAGDLSEHTTINSYQLDKMLRRRFSRPMEDLAATSFTRTTAITLVESLFTAKIERFIRFDQLEIRGQYGIDIPPPFHDYSIPKISAIQWLQGR